MGSYSGRAMLYEPDKFHTGGLISLSRHDFSKLLNILLITLLTAKSTMATEKM